MVPEIEANEVSPFGWIAPGIERSTIAGLKTYVVDLVQFDKVIVSSQQDRAVGPIVEQVMSKAVANAADVDRSRVGALPSPEVVNAVVDGPMSCGCKCPSIPASKP